MKKTLHIFLLLAIAGTYSASAQQASCPAAQNNRKTALSINEKDKFVSFESSSKQQAVLTQKYVPVVNPAAANEITLEKSANALTAAFGARTQLWADPRINAVSLIHRGALSYSPTSGQYYADVSKDGGNTFTLIEGPLYTDPPNVIRGRYPQGVIYNPSGNTVADSAYLAYFGVATDGTNWTHHVNGVYQVVNTQPNTNNQWAFGGGYTGYVPNAMTITQNGTIWVVDRESNGNLASLTFYDTINVIKGTWSGSDFTYTYQSIAYADLSGQNYADAKVAFAPNGTTGFICYLGRMTAVTGFAGFEPIIWKTTDGGNTWTGPTAVDLASLSAVTGSTLAGPDYTTGFECDMVVDMNGNPHITCEVGTCPADYSITPSYGQHGIFDIYSLNGGTSWQAQLIRYPQRFRGTFDLANSISEDTRPCVSTSWLGDRLFFTHFDTDSTLAADNTQPDAWTAGYNVASGTWVPAMNMTATIPNAGALVSYGNASHYVFGPSTGDCYEVPLSFMTYDVAGDYTSTCTHHYLNGIDFCFLGIEEQENNLFSVQQNYPNPCSGSTTFIVDLKSSSDLSIEVTNALGQKVSEMNYGRRAAGKHQFDYDGSRLNAGVYFYTVRSGGYSVTKRMIVE